MSGLLESMQGLSLSNTNTQDTPVRNATSATGGFTAPHVPHAPQATAESLVAGGGEALDGLHELIAWPSLYAREAGVLGLQWPRGLLLHGPPGCGKTLMVRAVAEECGASLHTVTAGDVYGSYLGESERRLRDAFDAARRDAEGGRTAVVFLDEVDALCPRRDSTRAQESRVVAQLLTLIDGAASQHAPTHTTPQPTQPTQAPLHTATNTQTQQGPPGQQSPHEQPSQERRGQGKLPGVTGHLVVVGATNRPGALDPALRRPGRLDREVVVSVPNASQREAILRLHTQGLTLSPGLDLSSVSRQCHGYSGADIAALAREMTLVALADTAGLLHTHNDTSHTDTHTPSSTTVTGRQSAVQASAAGTSSAVQASTQGGVSIQVVVTAEHVSAAMRRVGPSIVRGVEVEVPKASWDDIGGLSDVKKRLQQSVEWPLKHADAFRRLGLQPPRGVLLYGVPGCSKTSLARVAAAASGATLIPLSCAQLFSMYVGEGEATLRDVFRRARLAAPAILLLDEVDAVAARREEGSSASGGGGEGGVRLLTTLLTEMDGMEDSTGVLVLGTTNRPQAVDSALLRPGRFDTLLHVPPPDLEGRTQVLRIHTRGMPLAPDVDLTQLAQDTQGFTGAELAGLCREAALAALREDFTHASHVAWRHFQEARANSRAPAQSPLTVAALANWAKQGRRV